MAKVGWEAHTTLPPPVAVPAEAEHGKACHLVDEAHPVSLRLSASKGYGILKRTQRETFKTAEE